MSKKIKSKSSKISLKKKSPAGQIVWRERNLGEMLDHLDHLDHPKPLPGYKSTLPGAPGWWAKDNPGTAPLV